MIAISHRQFSEPLPADPQGQRLCQIFTHLWQAIVKPNDPNQPWETLTKYPLTPRKLWNLWQDAAQVVGVRFSSKDGTPYGLIDIDTGSPYHPKQDSDALPRLRSALEELGITRTFLLQSSWSGGLHLWLPLPERVPTFWFAAALKLGLEAHGFVLKSGTLETFPNCKAYARSGTFTQFQGHRLPLQPSTGSVLLTDDLQPIANTLTTFFDTWDTCAAAQDMETLRETIARAKVSFKRRPQKSQSVEHWRKELEREIGEGWTGQGQTNHMLKMIACYGVVFEQLTEEALVEYVQRIATSRPGYLQWCRHQHEISQRCQEWAKEAERYYWALGNESKRQGNIHCCGDANNTVDNNIVPLNQRRSQDAQARISQAVLQLRADNRLPSGIEARAQAIIEIAHCSKATLRKYLHLWHPEHYESGYENSAVCTAGINVGLSSSPASDDEADRSLKTSCREGVHTDPYMKGFKHLECSSLVHNFSSWGGTGGLSTTTDTKIALKTALEVGSTQQDSDHYAGSPNSVSFIPSSLISSNPPFHPPELGDRLVQPENSKYKNISKRTRLAKNCIDQETGTAIGRALKRLGWKIEELKQFTEVQIGKTIQTLTNEDAYLLLYRLQNLISPP